MTDGVFLTWDELGLFLFVAACTGVAGHLSGALWYTKRQFERHKAMLFDPKEGAIPVAVRDLRAEISEVSKKLKDDLSSVEGKIHESIGHVRTEITDGTGQIESVKTQISEVKAFTTSEVDRVRSDVAKLSGEITGAVRSIEAQVEGIRGQISTLTGGLTKDFDAFRSEIDEALGEIPGQEDLESLGEAIQAKTVAAIQGWWGSRIKEVREEAKAAGRELDPEGAELVAELEGLVGKKEAQKYAAGYKVIERIRRRRRGRQQEGTQGQPPSTNTPATPPGPSSVTPPGSRGPLQIHPDILAALEREGFKRAGDSPRPDGPTSKGKRSKGPRVKQTALSPPGAVPP